MKASVYDEIETIVDIESEFGGRIIKKGARGTVVECYSEPLEGYAVDLRIPSEAMESGWEYENVILYPEQFVVKSSHTQAAKGNI